jgi:hypothetical protein
VAEGVSTNAKWLWGKVRGKLGELASSSRENNNERNPDNL